MHTQRFLILKTLTDFLVSMNCFTKVYSQIETPIDRTEVPAVNVTWTNDLTELFGSKTQATQKLSITISIICRDDNWQEQSDLLSEQMHAQLMQTNLHDDIYQIIKKSSSVDQHMADLTCGVINHEYLISYYSNIFQN